MKYFILILSSLILMCKENLKSKKVEIPFDNQNNLQFTFLIFDINKIDRFFDTYKPLDFTNPKIKNEYERLSKIDFDIKNNELFNYKNNTAKIEREDYELTKEILNSGLPTKENRLTSLEYLFFNKTLPSKFEKKWVQTMLGNFEFNAKLLSLLREKNKTFDNLIYNGSESNDERLNIFFNEYITTEISPEIAYQIKETITKNELFEDIRFKTDKDIFIEFLDMVIQKQWKLILLDWN